MTSRRSARLITPNQRRAAQLQGTVYGFIVAGTLYTLAKIQGVPISPPYQVLLVTVGLASFALFRRYDLLSSWSLGRAGSIGSRVLYGWAFLVAGVLFGAYVLKYSDFFSRKLLLTWMIVTPAILFALHFAVSRISPKLVPMVAMRRTAIIVFVNDSARALARRLKDSPYYELLGFFDDRDLERSGGGLEGANFLGKGTAAADFVRKHRVQVVFVVLPDYANRRVVKVLDQLTDTTASVYYVPDFFVFSLMQAQISEVEGVPMLEVVETPFYGVDGLLKQLFDTVFAAVALAALAPLMLLIAVAVRLESPGPVLFHQKRYGLNGERFRVLKFRSMRVGAPNAGSQQATQDDERVTRVGRFLRRTSMDELPQFWNVLRGDMSVVGPRPHTVAHNEHYRKAVKRYMVRHKVKPGITGWAQVHGLRGETAQIERMEERIRYDLDYIRSWSPLLDLEIVARTVFMVLGGKNAY